MVRLPRLSLKYVFSGIIMLLCESAAVYIICIVSLVLCHISYLRLK